jgi:hypothetical protein
LLLGAKIIDPTAFDPPLIIESKSMLSLVLLLTSVARKFTIAVLGSSTVSS